MALFDLTSWLGKDIGGYTGGINDEGGLGQITRGYGNTGINWGDLLAAAMQYGSRNGGSQQLGGLIQDRYGANSLAQRGKVAAEAGQGIAQGQGAPRTWQTAGGGTAASLEGQGLEQQSGWGNSRRKAYGTGTGNAFTNWVSSSLGLP